MGCRQSIKSFLINSKNEDLSLKDLSLKLITLLGLIAPNRSSELTELDLQFMGKSEST